MRAHIASLALLLTTSASLGGCAEGPATTTRPSAGPSVSAPATRLPDGTIPWVDEPTTAEEFVQQPPARRVDPHAQPCTAAQLRGVLTRWEKPSNNDGGGLMVEPGIADASYLIGTVRVTNTGHLSCRLRGESNARLHDDAGEIKIGYSHDVNDEAAALITILPPAGDAKLRLDWSAPFCHRTKGRLALHIDLPEQGGVLIAPVRDTRKPPCSGHPDAPTTATGNLRTSTFTEHHRPLRFDSPLRHLTTAVEPATSARSGEPITFHITLRNPTDRAISLRPCPGYVIERFSRGSANVSAVNDHQAYRLNCRPVEAVPAEGSVRFEMRVTVPSAMAGRRLDVGWQMIAPRLGMPLWEGFDVAVTS